MKLELIEEIKEDQAEYKTYNCGLYTVDVSRYSNGCQHVSVFKDYHAEYLPDLFVEETFCKGFDSMKIQTTAYGAMKPEEIQKVIEGYQYAMEAVEAINAAFCR